MQNLHRNPGPLLLKQTSFPPSPATMKAFSVMFIIRKSCFVTPAHLVHHKLKHKTGEKIGHYFYRHRNSCHPPHILYITRLIQKYSRPLFLSPQKKLPPTPSLAFSTQTFQTGKFIMRRRGPRTDLLFLFSIFLSANVVCS